MGKAYVGVSNTPRRVKKMYVGVGNVAKKVKKAYIGVNNTPKLFYSADAEKPVFDFNKTFSVTNGFISNCVLYNNRIWLFSFSDKKLYGISAADSSDVKRISVTSSAASYSSLSNSGTYPITISVANGNLFLTQVRSANNYTLLKHIGFTGDENSIDFVEMSGSYPTINMPSSEGVYSYEYEQITPAQYADVVYNSSDSKYYAHIVSFVRYSYYPADNNVYRVMSIGDIYSFAFAASNWASSIQYDYFKSDTEYNSTKYAYNTKWDYPRPAYTFNSANSNEMIYTQIYKSLYTDPYSIEVKSSPKGTYNASDSGEQTDLTALNFRCVPVYGEGQIFSGFGAVDNGLRLVFASSMSGVTVPIDITSSNSVITSSDLALNYQSARGQAFIRSYGLWIFTNQHGIAFTLNPTNPDSYRYVDLTDEFVDISRYRTIYYNPSNSVIYIAGMNSTRSTIRVLKLDVSKWSFRD